MAIGTVGSKRCEIAASAPALIVVLVIILLNAFYL